MNSRRTISWVLAIAIVAAGATLDRPVFAQGSRGAGSGAVESGDGPGPLERLSQPITAENPIPRRLTAEMPPYPAEVRGRLETATVELMITIDDAGRVGEARAVRPTPRGVQTGAALEPFERSAIEAVRRWKYDPPVAPPMTFRVRFSFAANAPALMVAHGPVVYPFRGVMPPDSPWQTASKRTPPRKTKDRKPRWPDGVTLPKGSNAIVIIEVMLDEKGRIVSMRAIQGTPPFEAAALEAVKGWEFTPALADGKPVPFTMSVTVSFQGN